MKPNKSRLRSGKPDFIPGVFNYCDRWCERCPLTDRCRCYATMEERDHSAPIPRDLNEGEFWERLRQTFQESKEGLLQRAAEHGIDLDDPELTDEIAEHEEMVARLVEKHAPFLQKARAYALFVSEILSRADSLTNSPDVGIPGKLPVENQAAIVEALEIISYYHAFIYIKLTRAVHSLAEEELETDQSMRQLSSDADGSAKVALIGIDRSWLAWGSLLHHLQEGDESVLEALTQLSGLRNTAELKFPAARGFIRPGFDERSI